MLSLVIAWILTVAGSASAHQSIRGPTGAASAHGDSGGNGSPAQSWRGEPPQSRIASPRQRLTQWNWACPRQTFASAQVVAMLLVGLSQVMGYSVAGPSISVLAKTIQTPVPTVLSSWSLWCDCPPADLEREVAEYVAVGWRATPLWKGINFLSL